MSNKPNIPGNNGNSLRKPELMIRVVVNEKGEIRVENFPTNPDAALDIMHKATLGVANFFINAAMEGKMRNQSVQVVGANAISMLPKING